MTIGNFFIWAELDGVDDILEGGPMGREGGFNLVIHQRNAGGVVTPLQIRGRSEDGELVMEVMINGEQVGAIETRA